MSALRQYIDIITESNLFENPYQGADAEKFAAMTPADQEFLTRGGGVPDINNEFILARAPNKGQPAAPAPAQAPAQAPAAPAAPAQAPTANSVSAGASSDGNAGEEEARAAMAATAAAPPAQAAMPAPKNRDAMKFGQAFADARANGEKQFNWRGTPYAVKLKTPGNQIASAPAAQPAKALPPGLMGNIDSSSGMPTNPMPESAVKEDQTLARIIHLAGR